MNGPWIALAVLLLAISLGTGGLFSVLLIALMLCLGVVVVVFAACVVSQRFHYQKLTSTQVEELKNALPSLTNQGLTSNGDQRCLTGSSVIDKPVQEILEYVFRDYIYAWHFKLTHSTEFPDRLQDTVRAIVSSLAKRIKDVDWIPFLTTRVVNDVIYHVRLFKRSRIMLRSRNKESTDGKLVDLETMFFDAEVSAEGGKQCRDLVSTIQQEELTYLQDVAEILLFLLLPKDDFGAGSLRTLARELIVNVVLKPTLDLLSDPDFINQNIVWLYKDDIIKPDVFSMTIKYSECIEELQATKESASHEISVLRSNDSKSDTDSSLKQQLSSLLYLKKAIDTRIHRLQSGSDTDSFGIPAQIDWNQMTEPGLKLFDLPIEVILKNNIALSYFIDYMASIGCQAYLFFYLNIEGWKVSAEQQLQALEIELIQQQQLAPGESKHQDANRHRDSAMESMREAAHSIYEEYLSEKANPRLKIDDSVVKRLLFKIRTEPPDPEWFEESQVSVFDKLQSDELFLDAFKKSLGYVKLLAELDLLRDMSKSDDDESQSITGDEYSIYDSLSLNSYDASSLNETGYQSGSCVSLKSRGSESNLTAEEDPDATITEAKSRGTSPARKPIVNSHRRIGSGTIRFQKTHSRNPSQGSTGSIDLAPVLRAEIIEHQVSKDSKKFVVYAILVKSRDNKGQEDLRHVYRRYSDFYALQEKICTKFPDLTRLPFPSKKAFGNMDRSVIEKRQRVLNDFLQEILHTEVLQQHVGLVDIMQRFLDQASYEKERAQATSNVAKAVNTVVNPLKNSVKTVSNVVTAVPSQLFNTVDNVMDGLTKALQSRPPQTETLTDPMCGAAIELEASENIPLRILLLFMDEVFDLQERNQWLRRQIVTVLRQIIKAMFGDIVNRRIVDYFAQMTSPETISSYLTTFKQTMWPNGYPAASKPPRDENTKMRTRVAAKAALFSSLSDDLRRVIGSETSRTGLLMLFDMLQHPVLNKRLCIVLLEGVLQLVFSGQNFPEIFQKLHSRSPRVKNELRNSQRKHVDLQRRREKEA